MLELHVPVYLIIYIYKSLELTKKLMVYILIKLTSKLVYLYINWISYLHTVGFLILLQGKFDNYIHVNNKEFIFSQANNFLFWVKAVKWIVIRINANYRF